MSLISKWYLEPDALEAFSTEQSEKFIDNIAKINIFIGPNNSGKSRFMRSLFSQEKIRFETDSVDLAAINKPIKELNLSIQAFFGQHPNVSKIHNIKRSFEVSEVQAIESGTPYLGTAIDKIKQLANVPAAPSVTARTGSNIDPETARVALATPATHALETINALAEDLPETIEFKRIYIPVLRGLRPLTKDSDAKTSDVYHDRTVSDYFSKLGDDQTVFTGLKMYDLVKSLLLGDLSQRNRVQEFETFLGKTFFGGSDVTLIPRENEDVLYVKVGSEKEQPIHQLGDGVQQIIILAFPLFLYRDARRLVFIEEPELFLHPGMQRTFLELIMEESLGDVQCFFTTHSNHFLDITLDLEGISVFRFEKEEQDAGKEEVLPRFSIENTSNDDIRLLDCLGVKNSSVFLANCTIWVEGITERHYLRHFLKLYQSSLPGGTKYREDLHFAFVEYSGDNITHWSFLENEERPIQVERICNRLMLIADGDEPDGGSKKAERHEKLKETLGERFYLLPCREIENIISKEILLAVVEDYERSSEDVSSDFEELEFKKEYLGNFIEKRILKEVGSLTRQNKQRPYSAPSGTIKDKDVFCSRVINCTNTAEDLSENIKDLCKAIIDFIESCNS